MSMLELYLSYWFWLMLRPISVRDFFLNWDLDIGPLGISYCWFRQHRLLVTWRPILHTENGVLYYHHQRRKWALGPTDTNAKGKHHYRSIGPIWRLAYPDRLRGEWVQDEYMDSPEKRRVPIHRPTITINGFSPRTYWDNYGRNKLRYRLNLWRTKLHLPVIA